MSFRSRAGVLQIVGYLFALSLTGCARPKAVDKPFAPIARQLVTAINADDQPAIQRLFAPQMRQFLPSDKARQFFGEMTRQRGKIEQVKETQVDDGIGYFRLNAQRGAWDMQMMMDDAGLISNLMVLPGGPNILPARNSVPMQLPVRGQWEILWGGTTKKQNYHLPSPAQRRAIDFFIRDKTNSSHTGGGRSNADYFAYSKEIVAAAPGTVVEAVDGVPENKPGVMNEKQLFGNHIIVQQGAHEFAVYAHFQPGSLRVKQGETIKAGQLLGKCGNSGHSSYPHLHFHLQNSPDVNDGAGIMPYFQSARVLRDGETTLMKDYSPLRDDLVNAP